MKKIKSNKGFTLVELIVVIAVLAILAVGAVFAIRGVQANARRSTLESNANRLTTAMSNLNEAFGGLDMGDSPLDRAALHTWLQEVAEDADNWPGAVPDEIDDAAGIHDNELIIIIPPQERIHQHEVIRIGLANDHMADRLAEAILFIEPIGNQAVAFRTNQEAIADWSSIWSENLPVDGAGS